jgi:hypothetical protein
MRQTYTLATRVAAALTAAGFRATDGKRRHTGPNSVLVFDASPFDVAAIVRAIVPGADITQDGADTFVFLRAHSVVVDVAPARCNVLARAAAWGLWSRDAFVADAPLPRILWAPRGTVAYALELVGTLAYRGA